MSLSEQAAALLREYEGLIPAKVAVASGAASYTSLSRMVRAGLVERLGPGIYGDPNELDDDFALVQLRLSGGVFCRQTALYLHDMTDLTPASLEMNFPAGVHAQSAGELGVVAYHQIRTLYSLGVTTLATPAGHEVKAYDLERTLCDILRPPRPAAVDVTASALRAYVRRRDKNIPKLVRYAKELKVETKIRPYLEALL
ncbi:transcriptional regulator [Bombiscardovia apis]|uniref:Transcriptional regulator n=1 Tax=Bombiscardovia apis TaxID=2932182 RepID=A0ABM8BEF6_9BIFI|nr:type IV toxin-antitoxin system AbiEi family antitoxin domain-containing protein [Bombiscardovia apis]BDR55277.1 transcriptional regulator [Bombiscardovia apis]